MRVCPVCNEAHRARDRHACWIHLTPRQRAASIASVTRWTNHYQRSHRAEKTAHHGVSG
jgi:hypothetical protein